MEFSSTSFVMPSNLFSARIENENETELTSIFPAAVLSFIFLGGKMFDLAIPSKKNFFFFWPHRKKTDSLDFFWPTGSPSSSASHGWKTQMRTKVRLALRSSVTKAELSYAMERERERNKHERRLCILTAPKKCLYSGFDET